MNNKSLYINIGKERENMCEEQNLSNAEKLDVIEEGLLEISEFVYILKTALNNESTPAEMLPYANFASLISTKIRALFDKF